MYNKCAMLLCLFLLFTGMCTSHAKEVDPTEILPENVLDMTIPQILEKRNAEKTEKNTEEKEEEAIGEAISSGVGMLYISSPERTVAYDVLVNEDAIFLDEESLDILYRIVEAEAGTEDEEGRMLVANVVLNRVESRRFPDTVKAVVFQQRGGICQFSPVATGSYYRVKVSEKTKAAVDKVLRGEDTSQGALFFVNRYATNAENMSWFDTRCSFLFTHGRHDFFS